MTNFARGFIVGVVSLVVFFILAFGIKFIIDLILALLSLGYYG